MTERITLQLWDPKQAHQVIANQLWPWLKLNLTEGRRMVLLAHKEKRSDKQNRTMWSCLSDISAQVEWFGKRMDAESWKEFITGHLNGQELVPNMDGTGFISIGKGRSTSQMTRAEVAAIIDLCHAFGTDKGVNWSPTSLGRDPACADPETGEIMG